MLKKILTLFLITSLNSYVAKANISKVKELEKIDYKVIDDETTLDLESTFKFNYNKYFKVNHSNEENIYDIDFFNSKFKISFYDDIELYIPFGISYKIGYPDINDLKNYYLKRTIIANLGFSISWKALDYLKLGVSGDFDEDNGYALNFESKLLEKKDDEVDTQGSDIFKYGLGIFSEFNFKRSCLEFKPRIRLKLNRGVDLKNTDKYKSSLSDISGSMIFTPLIGLPLDFKWEVIEDVKFIINLSLNSYKSFVNKKYLKKTAYKNSGLKLDSFLKLTFDYRLFNVFKLTFPLKISSNIEVFRNKKAITNWNTNTIHLGPKVEFALDILDNLKLLTDISIDYKLLEVVAKPKFEFKVYRDFKIKCGLGFKFNSCT